MAAKPSNTTPNERPAQPGELCTCGLPATLVFATEKFGDVPFCGTGHRASTEGQDIPDLDTLSDNELVDLLLTQVSNLSRMEKVAKRTREALRARGRAT